MRHLLIIALAAAIGCGEKDDHDDHKGHGHDHSDEAVHGGTIVELSEVEDHGHLEVVIDHDAGTVTIWASTHDDGPMKMDGAPTLNFVANKTPIQVTGERDGDTWVFRHAALKGEPENARFMVKTGGKTFTPEWAHAH